MSSPRDLANFGQNILARNGLYLAGLNFLETPGGFLRPETLNFVKVSGTQAFSNPVRKDRSGLTGKAHHLLGKLFQ